MSKFQLAVIGIFAFFAVGGVIGFGLFKGNSGTLPPRTVIWGTVDKPSFSAYADYVTKRTDNVIRFDYKEIDPAVFDATLVEAIAINKGPDAILVSQETILKQTNKIIPVPYDNFPELEYKSTFIQEAELFLTGSGIKAIPFAIDPMVMYWNRTMFTNALISQPPKYWDQFITMAPQLTKKTQSLNIDESAFALGEYANIDHSKEILGLLMLQAGNPLVVETSQGYRSTLNSAFNSAVLPADSALTFYTQFADPQKEVYSWNRSLPRSKDLFLSNKLAVYFGYASEYVELRDKNPNLNFDVTVVPQPRTAEGKQAINISHGKVYGLSILKSSKHPSDAYNAITALTNKSSIAYWSKITGLPAVRRDALSAKSSDAVATVFASSALISRGWLDPDKAQTDRIYKDLIEGVTSGRQLYGEALRQADQKIKDILDKIKP